MAYTNILGTSGTTLNILSRTNQPGAGFTTAGVPKQGKVKVVAKLTFNYVQYVAATPVGSLLFPKDLGLESFDHLSFNLHSVNNGAVKTVANDSDAVYVPSTNAVVCYLARNAATEATGGQAVVMTITAEGDSSTVPALV